MAFQLRCPICRKAFRWDTSAGFPANCQLCGEFIGPDPDRDVTVISMPFIRSAKTDRTDKLYRDMEKGSETRMHIAAEQVGAPVSEMSAMKMTDMNDNQREGDIAAKLVPDKGEGQYFQPGSNGAEYMAGNASGAITVNGVTQTGVVPRAGASAISGIRNVMGQGPWNVATVK